MKKYIILDVVHVNVWPSTTSAVVRDSTTRRHAIRYRFPTCVDNRDNIHTISYKYEPV